VSRTHKLSRVAAPIALAACLTFGSASALFAEHNDNDWNHHGWGHDHDWHGNYGGSSSSFGLYLGNPGYYAPQPYYAPATPYYYAPQPNYYYAPQPGVGLQFNVH
jgi:hypothetical protein